MKPAIAWIAFFALALGVSHAGGHWELGVHYSYWSLNAVAPIIEESVTAEIDYYDAGISPLDFVSDGSNYGVEIRFFPGGEEGSFSIGLSYEWNRFNGTVTGRYEEDLGGGLVLKATADGSFELRPNAVHLNLRWDLWPAARIHPYIGFGFGFGALDGSLLLKTAQTTYFSGYTLDRVEEEQTRTLQEAPDELEAEEGETYPLGFIPILQFQIGVRGRVANNLYLLGEVALYDGLLFRAGLAYRF